MILDVFICGGRRIGEDPFPVAVLDFDCVTHLCALLAACRQVWRKHEMNCIGGPLGRYLNIAVVVNLFFLGIVVRDSYC